MMTSNSHEDRINGMADDMSDLLIGQDSMECFSAIVILAAQAIVECGEPHETFDQFVTALREATFGAPS